ncbi:hypothetical protein V6N12_034491 [Hibiscus sabdariffa]|uniref:Uncharacterized protein n=1 Tax=Hibiscus sabdariffa TaxID=183260 RepID=A0ABR2DHC9_9ROSI
MGAEIEGNVGVQSDMISNAPFGPEPNINLLNHNPSELFGIMVGLSHTLLGQLNLLFSVDKAEVTNGSSSSYPSSPSGAYPSNRFEAEAVANIAPLVGVT